MPFISVKSWPKDEATVKKVVDKINDLFLEEWGCPPQAITIAYEEVPQEEWVEKVAKVDIEPNEDKMMILTGEKKY